MENIAIDKNFAEGMEPSTEICSETLLVKNLKACLEEVVTIQVENKDLRKELGTKIIELGIANEKIQGLEKEVRELGNQKYVEEFTSKQFENSQKRLSEVNQEVGRLSADLDSVKTQWDEAKTKQKNLETKWLEEKEKCEKLEKDLVNEKTLLSSECKEKKNLESELERAKGDLEAVNTNLKNKNEEAKEANQKLLDFKGKMVDSLTRYFDKIAELLATDLATGEWKSETDQALKEYIDLIIKCDTEGKYSWSEYESIEQYLHNFKFNDSYLVRIANLIWWSKQNALSDKMKYLKHISLVEGMLLVIIELLSINGDTLQIPDTPLGETLQGYKLNNSGKLNFKEIFGNDFDYPAETLCELSRLSINGENGSCCYFGTNNK